MGLRLANSIFQVHGIVENGKVLVRRTLRRSQVLPFFRSLPTCLLGMEACASAHHWAREIAALGHAVRMMPPAYVKPYGASRGRLLPVEEGSTQRVVD